MLNDAQKSRIDAFVEHSFFSLIEDDSIEVKNRLIAYHATKSVLAFSEHEKQLDELGIRETVLSMGSVISHPYVQNPAESQVASRKNFAEHINYIVVKGNNNVDLIRKGLLNLIQVGTEGSNNEAVTANEVSKYILDKIDNKIKEHRKNLQQQNKQADNAVQQILESHQKTAIEGQLHFLCASNKIDELTAFLEKHFPKDANNANIKYDINARSIYGFSPLFWAAFNPNIQIAKKLIEHGADARALSDAELNVLDWIKFNGTSKGIESYFTSIGVKVKRKVTNKDFADLHIHAQLNILVMSFLGYVEVGDDNLNLFRSLLSRVLNKDCSDSNIEEVKSEIAKLHNKFKNDITGIRPIYNRGDILPENPSVDISILLQAYQSNFSEYLHRPDANFYDYIKLQCYAVFHGNLEILDNLNISNDLRLALLVVNNAHEELSKFLETQIDLNKGNLQFVLNYYLSQCKNKKLTLCLKTLNQLLKNDWFQPIFYTSGNQHEKPKHGIDGDDQFLLKVVDKSIDSRQNQVAEKLLKSSNFNPTLDLTLSKKLYHWAVDTNDFELQCIVIAHSHTDFSLRKLISRDTFITLVKEQKYSGAIKLALQGFLSGKISIEDINLGVLLSNGNIMLNGVACRGLVLSLANSRELNLPVERVDTLNRASILGTGILIQHQNPLLFSNLISRLPQTQQLLTPTEQGQGTQPSGSETEQNTSLPSP